VKTAGPSRHPHRTIDGVTITAQARTDVDRMTVALPLVAQLDDCDTPCDVIDALALRPFTTGAEPWAHTERIDRVRDGVTLMPVGATLVRVAGEPGRESRLARGEGWTLQAVVWSNRSAEVTVTAVSDELARTVLAEAVLDAEETVEPADDAVMMGFWHLSPLRGSRRAARPIAAAPWAEIRRNYAASTAERVDRLMTVRAENLAGRLLLLHGPPGTGKTTLLRALARAWQSWCDVDCVLDPERLFSEPSYLLDIVMGPEDKERWRLLVLEDCDELIHGAAKQATGQALSRLLNLTDGLLGQGREVLVAITTNEELSRLHPAVVRPGRCLAEIEVGPLPHDEAASWLGTASGVPQRGATLAELYALRAGHEGVEPREAAPSGFYL
jgi:hypothetical protein